MGTILVVDDDRRLQDILAINLRAEGYEVLAASNGHEGVEKARQNRPDAIIMDVAMPGLNGVEATAQLKTDPATNGIPIIMLTARSQVEELIVGLDCGAEEYIAKPFEMAELMARLRSIRRLSRARKELSAANDELAREVSNKTHRLGALYRLARRLNEVDSTDDILNLTIDAVHDATSAERISVMLPDDTGAYLRCAKAIGLDPSIADNVRIPCNDGIAGRVFMTGKTIVANAYNESASESTRYANEAFLSAPLISTTLMTGDEVLGVLNVTEKPDGSTFAPEETDCIRSIADMAAVALHNQIRRTRLEDSVKVLLTTVGRLAEFRDDETANHLERVQRYAELLASKLQNVPKYRDIVTDEFIRYLTLGTPLHDIGKVGIPDEILFKPGKLTLEEYETMKKHVEIGRCTLETAARDTGPMPLLQMCIDIISGHHEKYNGTGYPKGLYGDQIPLAARIVALADVYDAVTSRRPYKKPFTHERAIRIISGDSGTHFDPDVVEVFLTCTDEFERIRKENSSENEVSELSALIAGTSTLFQ